MKIEQSQQGTMTVLAPVGAIIDEDKVHLAQVLEDHIDSGDIRIILDMTDVPFIDSEGLEMLLDVAESTAARGGGMRIIKPSEIVKDILIATRLGNKIEIHAELVDARRSML